VLAIGFGLPYPTRAELLGAALLAIAVVVLSLGPRVGQPRVVFVNQPDSRP
jgi:hypothetical protein